jgi:hypothetical protein
MVNTQPALQDLAWPDGTCFGCGPANPNGLKLKSYWSDDGQYVLATYTPSPRYTGWEAWVYGGLLASLIDCHSNWTAMAYHYRQDGRDLISQPRIACVTGTLSVKYVKPTPMGETLYLKSWVEGEIARKTRVICEVAAGDTLTAIGDSIFVRLPPETEIG